MHKPVSFVRTSKEFPKTQKQTSGMVCATCRYALEDEVQTHDEYQNPLSLDALFVQHPVATYFVQVGKQSELSIEKNEFLGVCAGDVLTVDRALAPALGRLVLAVCDGNFIIARFTEHNGKQYLVTDEKHDTLHELSTEEGTSIWGVITAVSRKV